VSVALLTVALLAPGLAGAFAPIQASQLGDVPTTGGLRPGPVGLQPPVKRGAKPIAIKIQRAAVDAQIEAQQIIDGVMQNPSGPFVVSWYPETARLGEDNNVVMAGHLDYWDVGEAVFYNLGTLAKDDMIEVTGEDGLVYRYRVEWVRSFTVDDLDAEGVQEIVGSTPTEQLTLITCGGPFDYERGEYLERMVVRAIRAD
jgi:LPXTG-site transpeptidase (sortase) family protein